MKVEKSNSALGAEISDFDLSRSLSDDEISNFINVLSENEVVFIRDQNISHESHKRLATYFGSLQTHPAYPTVEGFPEITILENDRENPSKIEEWHTDMTFKANPPLGSILIGRIIPETGGDTLFSSLSAAFSDLDKDMQGQLQNLNAVHSFEHGFKESLAEEGGRERLAEALKENPPISHPMVKIHPVTNKKILYVNRLFTSHIEGMDSTESNELLDFLFDHIQKDKFVCRFNWEPNSIAFWDNRSVLHKPVNDYWPQLRRMERITIEG
tara:strand:+ start:202 stop:1011 length:810 start_codon:yes stop_codon:yes gene_type:complete